jgi:hypothetical protein
LAISVKDRVKRLKSGHALTHCRRAELAPEGCAPAISPTFRKQLRDFDRGLELFWNGWKNHWVLYRVHKSAAAACEDALFKEVELCGKRGQYRELGFWVFEHLRTLSLMQYHSEPEKQMDAFCDAQEAADEKREAEELKEIVSLTDDSAIHRGWAERGRQSILVEDNPAV